jgi:hypothetical protein
VKVKDARHLEYVLKCAESQLRVFKRYCTSKSIILAISLSVEKIFSMMKIFPLAGFANTPNIRYQFPSTYVRTEYQTFLASHRL